MGSPALIDPKKINALSYVLGNKQLDYHEMSRKEKVDLFKNLVGGLKKSFQYYPAFKPASLLGQSEVWDAWTNTEGPRTIKGPKGFHAKTMCTQLLLLSQSERQHLKVKRLLITRSGRLVLWEADYHMEDDQATWMAHRSTFQWFSDRQLASLLDDGADFFKHMIWRLEEMADQAISDRQILLGGIKRGAEAFKTAVGRVDWDTRD